MIYKNENKIAILLGAYNAEKYIEEQLLSVVSQTYEDYTLYIRDDDSTDNTLSIIKEFSEKYDNIVLIEDDLGNLGCNGNYFHLLLIVESEYYMFCNADDFWVDSKISLSIKEMLDSKKKYAGLPVIIHSDLAITNANLNIIHNSWWDTNNLDPSKITSYNEFGVCNTIAGATMLFNKEVKDITYPVSCFAPFFDHWMALKTKEYGGVTIPIYQSLVYYRQIGTNLAAVNLGDKNTIIYKIKNIAEVYKINMNQAVMLKKIGWGGYLKYMFYKIKIFTMLRFNIY